MFHKLPRPRISRRFRPRGKHYQCQFKEHNRLDFTNDCAFDDLDLAMSYVSLAVRFAQNLEAGQVVDSKSRQVVFACMCPAGIEIEDTLAVHEATGEYTQLIINGFDVKSKQIPNLKRQRKVAETLARLRQLHDELNAELCTRPKERPSIQSPADAFNILECFLGNLDHEELWVVNLDTRNRVMSLVQLYKGSVNSSQVRVGEVFRQAIIDNAPGILVAHNHPSSDPSPSPEDVAVTRAIVQAGKLLDISCLDHIVVGSGRYVSLKERGLGFE